MNKAFKQDSLKQHALVVGFFLPWKTHDGEHNQYVLLYLTEINTVSQCSQ